MAPLESGIYVISSKKGETYVGRAVAEESSLLPKPVIALAPGLQAQFWIVEKLKNDHYRLKIGGAPTGVKDNHVYAFLLDSERPEDWVIKHRDFHGPNSYTIERSSGNEGWVLPPHSSDPNHDAWVIVRRLQEHPSAPPQFSLDELWSFVRIDRK